MSEVPAEPARQMHDVRPMVARTSSNLGIWLFAGAVAISGGLLFQSLEARRETVSAPALGPTSDQPGGMIAAPPDISIPPEYGSTAEQDAALARLQYPRPRDDVLQAPPILRRSGPASIAPLPATSPPVRIYTEPSPGFVGRSNGQVFCAPTSGVVFDANRARPGLPQADSDTSKKDERVKAFHFASPSTTIPKGTVIQAVLETALDSTRAGFARAIISRDVFGFDGTRVLIGRGSRLIGEYKADLATGQKRALIEWQRLMRPDGVIINLDSPSADPLGRAGIQGKVNTHFFARFGGAILQSALNIGTQVGANQLSNGSVILAVPLTTQSQQLGQALPGSAQEKVQPTLTVRQGTSVSVFVARDLDFTPVEP